MDKPKEHDPLTKEQVEALLPRIVTDSDGRSRATGMIPKVFVKHAGDRRPCLVFFCEDGSFHVFSEIQAKQAAIDCGLDEAEAKRLNTQQGWRKLWDRP
jgi:hypothetical protein